MENQGIRIGNVISVSGATISGIIAADQDSAVVQFGALVKIPAAEAEVFGLIDNLRTELVPGDGNQAVWRIAKTLAGSMPGLGSRPFASARSTRTATCLPMP